MLIYIGVLSAVLSAIINLLLGASLVNIFLHVVSSTLLIVVVYLLVATLVKSYLPDLVSDIPGKVISSTATHDFNATNKNEDKPKENVNGITDIADNLKTASFTNLENVELDEGELSKNFGIKGKSIEKAAGAVRSSLNNRETR